MKVKFIWAVCLCFSSVSFAQKSKDWKLNSYQFNIGGVMSTKIPSASYINYEDIIISDLDKPFDEYAISLFDPKSLTNLRMRPLFNGNIQLYNSKTSSIQRFGLSVNSRMLSSFLTNYFVQVYQFIDTALVPSDFYSGVVRLNHVAPVLTLDYAYLKQLHVSKQLNFNFGVGAYAGMSLWNNINVVMNREYNGNGDAYPSGGFSTSDLYDSAVQSKFSKHNFNAGIYASFGLEYSLHDKQVENQRWYLTFENRICYDFFAVKNVPSSWFSFQSAQMFGLKYYLNRR
jgi:hypothetical protein